jgi:hypothetical protein
VPAKGIAAKSVKMTGGTKPKENGEKGFRKILKY